MKVRLMTYRFILLLLFPFGIGAQATHVLTFEEFMQMVKNYHPQAQRADITKEIGELMVLQSRGAFDPVLFAKYYEKEYSQNTYYEILDGGVKIPTWFGIELYAGIEQNDGIYINPERTLPPNGLTYTGISATLGQGLFIDKRRADLRTAQLMEQMNEEERKLRLNDLLLNASNTYFHWQAAYLMLEVNENALELARIRLEATKINAILGDSPFIDTLEASIQYQNRQVGLEEAKLNLANRRAMVSTFLWLENVIPVELAENVVPQSDYEYPLSALSNLLRLQTDSLITTHPAVIQNQLQINQLDIQRRLQAEQLKPVVNLKYNLLNEPFVNDFVGNYTLNNYNFGVDFRFPVLMRAGRGGLQIAKLRIRDAEYDLSHRIQLLNASAIQAKNEFNTTTTQLEIYNKTVTDLGALLSGEVQKFNAGESSLFMVNAREQSFINAQVRLIDLELKNRAALIRFTHSLGTLFDEF
jgi:outer membrane protein TolC